MSTSTAINGYVDPNFPNPMGPNDARIIIYGYTPSLGLAVLAVILFLIAFALHLWLLIRYRTWYFSTVLIGTFMEVVGYIFRLLSSQQDPYSIPWFVVQYFFIVVAPVFFSAAVYTLVSVLISIYGREYAPMPPKLILGTFIACDVIVAITSQAKLILGTFIACDVIATIIQIAGAALVGVAYSNQKDPTTYNHILLAGLAFQVFSFAVFLGVLAATLYKARSSPKSVGKSFIIALIVATLAVYLRTCFRLAETAEGLMKTLSTHEVYFGCLEFAPIVVAVYLFVWWHPGRWLQHQRTRKSDREFES